MGWPFPSAFKTSWPSFPPQSPNLNSLKTQVVWLPLPPPQLFDRSWLLSIVLSRGLSQSSLVLLWGLLSFVNKTDQVMAEETYQPKMQESKRRRVGNKKGGKAKKKPKMFQGSREKVKIDQKMKKLFRKRAREYNSDDDDGEETTNEIRDVNADSRNSNVAVGRKSYERDDNRDTGEANGSSGDEADEIQPGITKFTEGCRAFRIAFKKIIKRNVSEGSLGPMLSGHKKLIAEKLAEEETEQKGKGGAKKEKHLVKEKGHVKPANFLDSHEKFLISVATKGVVKLFNAVNKAQNAQKRLNPARSKDAKEIRKQRKQAFFSELSKPSSQLADTSAKGDGPGWAPLRDNYMLTNPKLKNWDKGQDSVVEDIGSMSVDSSSDDD